MQTLRLTSIMQHEVSFLSINERKTRYIRIQLVVQRCDVQEVSGASLINTLMSEKVCEHICKF